MAAWQNFEHLYFDIATLTLHTYRGSSSFHDHEDSDYLIFLLENSANVLKICFKSIFELLDYSCSS